MTWPSLRRQRQCHARRREHEQVLRRLDDIDRNTGLLYDSVHKSNEPHHSTCQHFFIGDGEASPQGYEVLAEKVDQLLAGSFLLLPDTACLSTAVACNNVGLVPKPPMRKCSFKALTSILEPLPATSESALLLGPNSIAEAGTSTDMPCSFQTMSSK